MMTKRFGLSCGQDYEFENFEDSEDKMNLSVLDVGGQVLVVSQFTLTVIAGKAKTELFQCRKTRTC